MDKTELIKLLEKLSDEQVKKLIHHLKEVDDPDIHDLISSLLS